MVFFVVASFSLQSAYSAKWDSAIDEIQVALEKTGLVDVASIRSEVFTSVSFANYIPELCVVLQALESKEIRTIVWDPTAAGWRAFDPRNPKDLPDLSHYGVRYSPQLLAGPVPARERRIPTSTHR